MKFKKIIVISICILFTNISINCTSSKHYNKKNNVRYIEFCDLQNNLDKKVRIIANYAGSVEFWRIFSVEKCNKDIHAEFNYGKTRISKNHKKLIKDVYKSEGTHYLQVDVVGKFEMYKPERFVFIVDRFIEIKVKEH